MTENSFQRPGPHTNDPAHEMLVAFLVMDIQRNPEWARELADRIEQVKTGMLPVWERIGNAYRLELTGKGALIDFNYDTEPLPGTFPLPGIGPFGLLRNTKINHYGKMLFRWIYWHILLRGKEMPIEAHMTMAGKKNNID